MRRLYIAFFIVFLIGCVSPEISPEITTIESPTESLMQAVSILDEKTVWISGHDASIMKSTDGGLTWDLFTHPTADSLQFRDIHSISKSQAIVMSAGPGSLSKIFSFQAPDIWLENFVMEDSLGFLDCIDFWDDQRGIAYGDAIDRFPYILITNDGGTSWSRADTLNLPVAGKGEGGFAASGTCVTVGENGRAWIATGASGNCRFLITEDYGSSWKEVDSPLVRGDAAGNTSVSFVGKIGVVTGGDLAKPTEYTDNCAFSQDGGESWKLTNQPRTPGAFYGSAITKMDEQVFAFVCGPNGIDYTTDFGETWTTLDSLNYWALDMHENSGYAVGTDGKILRISLQP